MEDKTEVIEIDGDIRGVKRKITDVTVEVKAKINPDEIEIDGEDKEATNVVARKPEEEEDEDANDPVRLWEDGWKDRYYKVKFDVAEDDVEFRQKVAKHYYYYYLFQIYT